jgi:thymidylate synthase (FAD)
LKVNLVSFTQPAGKLENTDIKDAKDLIVYCARISNPSNQMNMKTADILVKYLQKHRHWSPFEMVDVTLEIETTRDIARQMLRHRSFSFQEFSQRYADVGSLGDVFEYSCARLQDKKNRQNSYEVDDGELHDLWDEIQIKVASVAYDGYRKALNAGIAKEVARKLLPEGLTKSRLFMKGSIRSWIHYLEVRGPESGAQKEHMHVAAEVAKAVSKVFSVQEDKEEEKK